MKPSNKDKLKINLLGFYEGDSKYTSCVYNWFYTYKTGIPNQDIYIGHRIQNSKYIYWSNIQKRNFHFSYFELDEMLDFLYTHLPLYLESINNDKS